MVIGGSGEETKMDRAKVEFVVSVEMPIDDNTMEAVLAALPAVIEDTVPEAASVFADIMSVEEIT